jgi:hypothetical protein
MLCVYKLQSVISTMKFETITYRFLLGVVAFGLLSFNLSAQITQPALYEREHKDSEHTFLVISMGDNGIALVRDTEKFEGNKKNWEIIFLDSALNESWTCKIDIDQRMNILGHDYRNGNIYLIFEEPENSGRQINLTEIRLSEREVKQHKFKPDVTIHYTHFSILKNKAVFGGYLMKEPTLLMYDLSNESTKVIPGTFSMKEELMDVRNNSNDTFNALLIERDSKSIKKLIVRTYDSNGVLLVDDVIAIDEDKTIIEAISSSLVRDELVVMGTWTYGSSKQAAGIFSVMVDPFNEQKVNYYDFAELNHFLDYLKPKKISKIKAKAEWRKSVGKVPEFRVHLYPVKIEEDKEGFSLLTEVYDPPSNYYNARSTSPYGYNPYNNYPYGYSPYGSMYPYRPYNLPFGYPYGTNSTSSYDTRMIHSSLIFFDGNGKLVADQSLTFPEIKLESKEQVSDFINLGTRTIMVCKEEKEIIAQINQSDGTVVQTEKITPALKNSGEIMKTESQDKGTIRFWYGHNFYVYGYHKLKDNLEKTTRNVFYINKISVK